MKPRTRNAVAALAVTAVVVPLTVTATTAAWNTREWVHGEVGTSTLDCTAGVGFEAESSGRFLSGELLGLNLDPIAELQQMALAIEADGTATVSPGDAIDLGSTPPTDYVYANPFDVTALSAINVDLTGFTVGLPGAALGAVNQYARAGADGTATGASGLINDSGAVLVSQDTPPASLPAPARIGLSGVLPVVAGIADADLQVGAVGASSQIDGCAILREELWGEAAPATAVVRDYGIAGLGLQLDAPVVEGLVETVTTGIDTLDATLASLTGPGGLIASGIGAQVDLALPGILTTSVGGDVTVSGVDLLGAVSALLTTPLTDGVVTIDLEAGAIDVDLDALLPSLNDAAPNTEIVLNDTVLNPILDRAGDLLDNWTSQLVSAVTAELREADVDIAVDVLVAAPGITIPSIPPLPPIQLLGLDVLSADVTFSGTLGALLDGTAVLDIDADVVGLIGPVNTLLSALGLPTVTDLLGVVEGLTGGIVTSLANTLTTTVIGAVTTLGTTLATVAGTVITALGGVVAALPSVVSLMVNVQPDQSNAPPGSVAIPATGDSTAQYSVSALRLGLVDALGTAAAVTFATATAGPVTAP